MPFQTTRSTSQTEREASYLSARGRGEVGRGACEDDMVADGEGGVLRVEAHLLAVAKLELVGRAAVFNVVLLEARMERRLMVVTKMRC